MSKSKILLNIDTYLPGFRGGGPVQSIKNFIELLSDDFDFYIFTVNHDFGVIQPYETVQTDRWNECYGAKIFYSSDKQKNKNLYNILKGGEFSLVFLNSFFSTDTIKVILIYRFLRLKIPITLMPRGELSKGALDIKSTKKKIYIRIVKLTGFLKNIHYLATAQDEYEQVEKILATKKIKLLSNIPNTEKNIIINTKEQKILKVVFLSRITEKKNLDYALKTLKLCQSEIRFDIYGTLEDKNYWNECKKIIKHLPSNISVSYRGELINEKVIETLAKYDLFYFPTKSENYGHVISEALQASIPVLISNRTPWLDLEEKKLGWVYDLSESSEFVNVLEGLAQLEKEEHNNFKEHIFKTFDVKSAAYEVSLKYKKVLKKLIK